LIKKMNLKTIKIMKLFINIHFIYFYDEKSIIFIVSNFIFMLQLFLTVQNFLTNMYLFRNHLLNFRMTFVFCFEISYNFLCVTRIQKCIELAIETHVN
jgi:hypothetical protein